MATGQELIEDALLLIGVIAPGESLEPAVVNNGLRQLNRMLSTFSVEGGPVFFKTMDSVTWTADEPSRTIGTAGNLAVARPMDIYSIQARVSGNDYDIEKISFEQYQGILIKDTESDFPQVFAYQPTYPNGTIYLNPVPTSNITIRITSLKPLSALTLDGTVSLPEGYEEMIQYNLAVRLAPIHGVVPTQEIKDLAFNSKQAINILNSEDNEMRPDYLAPDSGSYDAYWKEINR